MTRRSFLGLLLGGAALAATSCAATPTVTPTPTRARAEATPTTGTSSVATAAPPTSTQPPAMATPAAQTTAALPTRAVATPAAATPAAATATVAPATATPAASPTTNPAGNRMPSPGYGVHVFLGYTNADTQRDINLAKAGGFGWVKQRMDWDSLAPDEQGQMKPEVLATYDGIVNSVSAAGLKLTVRLGSPPRWATPLRKDYPNPPPDDLSDTGPFANFLYGLASRYKGKVAAWQIWNEPNLRREWGKIPDAAEYARLLKTAYRVMKIADPNAIIISAGLSPTGTTPPEAVPDDSYLEQMYQAFASRSSDGYFDVLGAHGAGYKAPPEMDPSQVAADKLYGGHRSFCFRRVEDLRAVMEKYGDSKKQVSLLEFGWVIDGGAKLDPTYRWYAVSPETQAKYIVGAYKWAKEHWSSWIGVMNVIYILSPDFPDTGEYYWWGITDPDGSPRPAYTQFKAWRAAAG